MLSMYVEMIRIRFLMMLAYRVNYYSGILVYSINIGAYYFLWNAIYAGQPSLGGLTPLQMTSYVAVSWMARAFYFNNIDREMAMEIKDGKVAIEMIRPYNYLAVKMMQALGEGMFRLLFFSVPGMVIVSFFFPIVFPSDWTSWAVYGVSLMFSFIINTEINLITGVLAFFFLNNDGIMRAKKVIVDLFSGLILPISFYPDWARAILEYLPFQAIGYLPGLIFTGAIEGEALQQALLVQLIWSLVLLLPLYFLWIQAKKTLVVQGG
ncbi:ABC-2 family transporter protein [Ammoniphilus sp. YIM 78166]|uniref:ABC transporter permease n=1 Tax=Ammoniphilus sp. YIM 78166 TaxID=1644106 RepID=UPI00106FCB68|nr:ABC-2 family transporter protein [Ammoniphilus sp. YIM 78166]